MLACVNVCTKGALREAGRTNTDVHAGALRALFLYWAGGAVTGESCESGE